MVRDVRTASEEDQYEESEQLFVRTTDCFRMYFRIPTLTGPGTTSGTSVLVTAGMHTGDIPLRQLIPCRAPRATFNLESK
jgi:hypothetical protein